VVVERAECVGHVETVVDRVEMLEEEAVDMHPAVEEVLPCVEHHPNAAQFFFSFVSISKKKT